MLNICILGSTGSIGTQALNIIRKNRDKFNALALSAHSNLRLLKEQLYEFKPKYCVLTDSSRAGEIDPKDFPSTKFLFGQEGLKQVVSLKEVDVVLVAIVGIAALYPTIEAINAKKRIALASKEVMVSCGEYVKGLAAKTGSQIIPVDSEHSAIFQCMQGQIEGSLKRLILTASGGALRDLSRDQLEKVTPEMALLHPNWKMGSKITIDSATMMNKGFEVIEARHFFDISADRIECVMHPQSIAHSMIELKDGSVLAQMSYPNMEIPIMYSFTYPQRIESGVPSLDFIALKRLDFEAIDADKYPCLELAYRALKAGEMYPAILNLANDDAVRLFLEGRIPFTKIPQLIEEALDSIDGSIKCTPENVYCIGSKVRDFIAARV